MDLAEDLKSGKYIGKDAIGDLIPYLLEGITYAIPVNSSEKLRIHFTAAIKKYRNPDISFEEILSDLSIDEFSDDESISYEDIIRYLITSSVDITGNVMMNLPDVLKKNKHECSYGEMCYIAAMSRIRSSFRSAVILLRNGFFVEVVPVFRLIYEQLCWACFTIDETDNEKIKGNKTSKNTESLKKKINIEYGKFYGFFSKEAHLSPDTLEKYIYTDNQDLGIIFRSGKKCKQETVTLILLFKIYIEVAYYAIKEHFKLPDEEEKYFTEFLQTQDMVWKTCASSYNDGKVKISFINKL